MVTCFAKRRPPGTRSGTYFLLLGIVFCWLGQAQGKDMAGRIPVPDWMDAVPVAETMVINGLPSVVHQFRVDRPKKDIIAFYRDRWREPWEVDASGYKEAKADFWHVISRLEDKRYLLTVQVKSTGTFTCNGYLAQGDLKNMDKKLTVGADVPKMQGSQVVNELTSHDPGKTGRTLIVVNNYSAKSNGTFYRQYYTDRNWSQLIDFPQQKGHVLAYRKGSREAHLVINENFNSTQIVINLVDND